MKKYLKAFFSISMCLSFFYSSSQQNADTAKDNKEALATLNGYLAALNEHDIAKAISYFSNTKDFLVYANGKGMNYEEFTTGLRTTFLQIRAMLVRYDTVYVRNIGGNAVLITGRFHESFTDVNGREFDFDITASSILLKRKGQWKVAYVTEVDQLVSD